VFYIFAKNDLFLAYPTTITIMFKLLAEILSKEGFHGEMISSFVVPGHDDRSNGWTFKVSFNKVGNWI